MLLLPLPRSQGPLQELGGLFQRPMEPGQPCKNAKYHFGSKACPILQLPSSVKNFLEVFPPFPLHLDLGILGVWFLNHMIVICRIIDRTATVVALENLSDQTPEELDEEEQGELSSKHWPASARKRSGSSRGWSSRISTKSWASPRGEGRGLSRRSPRGR